MTDAFDLVPDADRQEQERPVVPGEVPDAPPTMTVDASEGDAVEQAQPAPMPDDDEAH